MPDRTLIVSTSVAYLLAATLFFPLAMTLFYIFHSNIYTQNEYRQLYREHWNMPIFTDLSVISLEESCPAGFEPLTFGKTDHVSEPNICDELCEAGCCLSPEVDRYPYDNWRDTRFCYKPLINEANEVFNYYSSPVYASCLESTVDCGIIDSAGQHFCANSLDGCPIQDIQIVEPSTQIPSSYTQIPLKDNYHVLIYTRGNPSLKIYSYLKITHGPLCSLYYERALTPDTFTSLAITSKFYNECATRLNGYRLNPNFTIIDRNVGLGMLEAMKYPYEMIMQFPIRRLEKYKDFYLQGGLYPGNKCFFDYNRELNHTISQGFLSDFAHGSYNFSLVMYSAIYPFFMLAMFALCVLADGFATRVRVKTWHKIALFVIQALFIVPVIISYGHYGLKMYFHQGDKIIKSVMGEDVKKCFEPFDFANIEWISNESSNDWMFEMHAVMFVFLGIFSIRTYIYLARNAN